MSNPQFNTKINCLDQYKDEMGVISEVDPH